jgi:hypothetical protein
MIWKRNVSGADPGKELSQGWANEHRSCIFSYLVLLHTTFEFYGLNPGYSTPSPGYPWTIDDRWAKNVASHNCSREPNSILETVPWQWTTPTLKSRLYPVLKAHTQGRVWGRKCVDSLTLAKGLVKTQNLQYISCNCTIAAPPTQIHTMLCLWSSALSPSHLRLNMYTINWIALF